MVAVLLAPTIKLVRPLSITVLFMWQFPSFVRLTSVLVKRFAGCPKKSLVEGHLSGRPLWWCLTSLCT